MYTDLIIVLSKLLPCFVFSLIDIWKLLFTKECVGFGAAQTVFLDVT
jgi:hypothetical protein